MLLDTFGCLKSDAIIPMRSSWRSAQCSRYQQMQPLLRHRATSKQMWSHISFSAPFLYHQQGNGMAHPRWWARFCDSELIQSLFVKQTEKRSIHASINHTDQPQTSQVTHSLVLLVLCPPLLCYSQPALASSSLVTFSFFWKSMLGLREGHGTILNLSCTREG